MIRLPYKQFWTQMSGENIFSANKKYVHRFCFLLHPLNYSLENLKAVSKARV